jgi:hypothetical protein
VELACLVLAADGQGVDEEHLGNEKNINKGKVGVAGLIMVAAVVAMLA